MNTKLFIAGLAVSMSVIGSAMAEDLATIEGIPAEAISHGDMDKVEGKFFAYIPGIANFHVNENTGLVSKYNALRGGWIPYEYFKNLNLGAQLKLLQAGGIIQPNINTVSSPTLVSHFILPSLKRNYP